MKARIGVIGGSGIYEIDGIKNLKEIEVATPFGKPSDKLMVGELGGEKVAFLPRHGKGHRIMPSGINFRANIYAMKYLGVEWIISLSAVGSMRENISPGEVVVVDQFFDRTKTRPLSFFGNGLVGHISFAKPVCPVLGEVIYKACQKAEAKVHKGGTYVCIEGPQFSTLGESLIYRKWGVDLIGMTAIPEVKLAREAEICYSTLALVTDFDCWHPDHDAVTVDMVVQQLISNSVIAKKVIRNAIPLIPVDRNKCGCASALENAIMTSPQAMDKTMLKNLDIIVGKYIKKRRK